MIAPLDDHSALDGDDLLATLAFLDDFGESALSELLADLEHGSSAPEGVLVSSDLVELSGVIDTSEQFMQTEESSTLTTTTNSNTTNDGSTGHQQPRQSQTTTKRRKEIVLLRKQAEQLETQLIKIQVEERIQNSASSSSSSCATNTTTLARHTHQYGRIARRHMWREIARNQSGQRADTERENIRLKLLLGRQLEIAKSLQRHLARAISSNKASDRQSGTNLATPVFTRTPADTALVSRLLAGLEVSYAEIDAVFAACGVVDSPTSRVGARLRSSGKALELNAVGTKALPFAFDAVVRAVWDHYIHGIEHIPSRMYYSKAPKVFLHATNACIKRHHAELATKTTGASFGVKQVLQRFDEPDRVVIVLRTYIDPIEFGHERLPDVSFLERGYIAIKKPIDSDSITQDPITLVQAEHVVTPIFSHRWAASNENYPNLGAIADFTMAVATANVRATQQAIEDELVELSMKMKL